MQPTSAERRRKLNLTPYLAELAALTGRPVEIDELGSPEQAATMRQAGRSLVAQSAASVEIPFGDRVSEQFHAFIQRLHAANPSSISIWTPRTIDCGTLVVPSLAAIHFDFDFTINEDGILSFVTVDLMDRLLLDFSVSSAGNQSMIIETQGVNWSRVAYG